jgi:4-hydroxybenzoate polyprenyltransferase
MKKYPLGLYIVGVIVVLAIINYIAWSVGGEAKLKSFELLSAGFLLGMLAMYIAVHVYRWK